MKGKIICLEGLDCSFKETQSKMIKEKLQEMYPDKTIVSFSFPNYEKESSYFVREYLAGNYGEINETSYITSGLFFAMDRFDTYHKEIKELYESGAIIILDRYTFSNVYYQLAKHEILKEQYTIHVNRITNRKQNVYGDYTKLLMNQLLHVEFGDLGLPVPDAVVFLNTNAELSSKMASNKKTADINEKSLEYQKIVDFVYDKVQEGIMYKKYLNEMYKDIKFFKVSCVTERGNEFRTKEEINDDIMNKLSEVKLDV